MLRIIAAVIGCLTVSVLAWIAPVQAHSWYSFACCSGHDCHPMPINAVEASPAGWRIKNTGEVVPYGDKKEQQSQDSDFHVCRFGDLVEPPEKRGTIRCLYVPGAGS